MEATSLNAQKLRIGNWVQPIVGDPGQVTGIMNQEVKDGIYESVYVNYQSFLPQHLMSITLNEEWLTRFGFKQQSQIHNLYFKGVFRYTLHYKTITILRPCDKDGESKNGPCGHIFVTDRIKCEYVHQLQNLYYALTGNELTV